MQHDVIYAPQPWGLPLKERLLPQLLQDRGYVTRAVGKWHLGFFKADYTPIRRGFLSHFGTWTGHQDHFTHIAHGRRSGYDLHRDLNVSWEGQGKYSGDLFTEEAESLIQQHDITKPLFMYLSYCTPHSPVQAPHEEVRKLKQIQWKRRRTYAAMVTKLDESVGKVIQSLKNKGMLDNSIILFLSDNGGATHGYNRNVASNWPLKGGKDTLWEGGVRAVGLIWSPLLHDVPKVHRGLVNVQDWLPTLLHVVDSHISEDLNELDGVSQWQSLSNGSTSPYDTMLHNIDRIRGIAAVRQGKWKLVVGRTHSGHYDGWYGELKGSVPYNLEDIRGSPVGRAIQNTTSPLPTDTTMWAMRANATVFCQQTGKEPTIRKCKSHIAPCLFDLEADPCELNNLAMSNYKVTQHLLTLLKSYPHTQPCNKHADPRSYPEHWNHTWTHWQDFLQNV